MECRHKDRPLQQVQIELDFAQRMWKDNARQWGMIGTSDFGKVHWDLVYGILKIENSLYTGKLITICKKLIEGPFGADAIIGCVLKDAG